MSGGGFRASIPSSVWNTIQNIKEITGNHGEEEIYAMLKECSMDPNETTHKLLFQDTFHEVKSKRDKKKENLNNKDSAETRWRSGTQGRGGRGGRVISSPRFLSHDAGGGRNAGSGKENGAVAPSLPVSQERISVASSSPVANGPICTSGNTTIVQPSNTSAESVPQISSSLVGAMDVDSTLNPVDVNKSPSLAFGAECARDKSASSSTNLSMLQAPTFSSAICFSSSDPVLVPSDLQVPSSLVAMKREMGIHRNPVSEIGSSAQGKASIKSRGVEKNQLSESAQPSSTLSHAGSSVSRPSSNYSNRSQQIASTQKVGSNKEWKPKPTNTSVQGPGTPATSEAPTITVVQPQATSDVLDSREVTSKLQKKLEELHLYQRQHVILPRQHVILPNHIHVPESERTKLSFGSFGAGFVVVTSNSGGLDSDKSRIPVSEASQGTEVAVEEQSLSNQNVMDATELGDYPGLVPSPTNVPENLSFAQVDVSSSATTGINESNQDDTFPSGGPPYSVVHASTNYSCGFVPPILASQLAPLENSESQGRDVSRSPSFVVQQPFNPANYYTQFYRSNADGDGRHSPFPSPSVATKYNGNVANLPSPNSQSPQEGGVLSAGPTPLITQAASLMQSSIAVTQQPVPIFRPPTGMHIPHYPPNYFPYGHYYSPFYIPSPAIHHFLGNGAFPQQPQSGGVYPASPALATAGVKYSFPQYKTGNNNTGNSAYMARGYGPYGSSATGYNPSSTATAGNSTTNEDLGASQFKESNVYIAGQQSEGSAVWVTGPGGEISSLPTSSYYNIPPHGQHVTFAPPTQAAHGTFAGIFHPAQAAVTATTVHPLLQQSQAMAGAVDIVGHEGDVYQQSQHSQINWPHNY